MGVWFVKVQERHQPSKMLTHLRCLVLETDLINQCWLKWSIRCVWRGEKTMTFLTLTHKMRELWLELFYSPHPVISSPSAPLVILSPSTSHLIFTQQAQVKHIFLWTRPDFCLLLVKFVHSDTVFYQKPLLPVNSPSTHQVPQTSPLFPLTWHLSVS